jgi:hypothetical protein
LLQDALGGTRFLRLFRGACCTLRDFLVIGAGLGFCGLSVGFGEAFGAELGAGFGDGLGICCCGLSVGFGEAFGAGAGFADDLQNDVGACACIGVGEVRGVGADGVKGVGANWGIGVGGSVCMGVSADGVEIGVQVEGRSGVGTVSYCFSKEIIISKILLIIVVLFTEFPSQR